MVLVDAPRPRVGLTAHGESPRGFVSEVWINLEFRTQTYLPPVASYEVRPESWQPVAHVHGPQGQESLASFGPPALTAAARPHLDHELARALGVATP